MRIFEWSRHGGRRFICLERLSSLCVMHLHRARIRMRGVLRSAAAHCARNRSTKREREREQKGEYTCARMKWRGGAKICKPQKRHRRSGIQGHGAGERIPNGRVACTLVCSGALRAHRAAKTATSWTSRKQLSRGAPVLSPQRSRLAVSALNHKDSGRLLSRTRGAPGAA